MLETYQHASWRLRLLTGHHIVGPAPFSIRRWCLLKYILALSPALQPPAMYEGTLCLWSSGMENRAKQTCNTGNLDARSHAIKMPNCMCIACGGQLSYAIFSGHLRSFQPVPSFKMGCTLKQLYQCCTTAVCQSAVCLCAVTTA